MTRIVNLAFDDHAPVAADHEVVLVGVVVQMERKAVARLDRVHVEIDGALGKCRQIDRMVAWIAGKVVAERRLEQVSLVGGRTFRVRGAFCMTGASAAPASGLLAQTSAVAAPSAHFQV